MTLLAPSQVKAPVTPVLHEMKDALAAIEHNHPVVLITGRAGTGKTTLIRKLIKEGGKGQVVLAPTGVAAVNVGGQTIHSFFRIPPRMHNVSEILPRRGGKKLFSGLKRIIIDEVSMVRADVMDAVDHALKINRRDHRPFGGVQIVLVGDFLQLPPVVRGAEAQILSQMGYATPFAFSAKCLQGHSVTKVELTKVYRQESLDYVELLGNLRTGHDLGLAIEKFNIHCHGEHKRDASPIILTGTNAVAQRYNKKGMVDLPSQAMTYTGILSGQFNLKQDKLPAPEELMLKEGARIMMVRNDKQKRWVNGSLGTVTRLSPLSVWVELDDAFDGGTGPYEVKKESWENMRYVWNAEAAQIEAEEAGSYTQLPIMPAWAITIHKAQGLTLENVRVDLKSGAFVSGQAYVALSRARSLEGLSFAYPLKDSDILIDPRIKGFFEELEQLS